MVALALLGLPACGGGELATRWVPPQAAIVRCTMAGRDRMPPVLLDLPLPALPTGLLARQLDPMALNDMGFEREQMVCAALESPPSERIDEVRGELMVLLEAHSQVSARARTALGRCACDVARLADVAGLLASCRDQPHRSECAPTPAQLEEALALVEPLRDALASTPVPRLHWRVAGRTDRPGWMARRLPELLPRHEGGATVYLPGQAIPSRHNHVLVRRLLDLPGVTAVLRLDGGRSMLVIRELDGALVVDLVAFPELDARLAPLLPFIDEARADDVVDVLARPSTSWSPPLPLDKGNLIHLDREGLRAVDSMLLAMAPLAGMGKAPRSLPEPIEPPLVDAVTLQAEFGASGKRLRAQLRLSEDGRQWAQLLGKAVLAPPMDVLGLPLDPPLPRPSLEEMPTSIVHGTATEWLVIDGLRRIPALLHRLEMVHPNAVGGRLDAWDVSLPAGAVSPGGTVSPPLPLREWAQRVGSEPYRLRTSFDPARNFLELVLEPD